MKYIVRVAIGDYYDYVEFVNEESANEYAKRWATKKNVSVKTLKK